MKFNMNWKWLLGIKKQHQKIVLDPKTIKANRKKKIIKGLIWTAYGLLGMVLFVAGAFAWFSKDLPTPEKIANSRPTESTKIYDRTGETLLYETGNEKRTIVKSDEISKYLKEATVATEDTEFYQHHGVNVMSILSAIKDKLLGRTAILRGGSTITQQYVKNALLTSDRSYVRKIKEAILAVELEFMYSKDEILTMYLNQIPYGNATAGAEAASETYYGKKAKDISLTEAATLAAIPKAPTKFSPWGTHVDDLIVRRNYVLDRMAETGKISVAEATEAKKVDTTTIGAGLKARHEAMVAPHFAMYIMEQVANEYGEETVQKQGLKIITTLNYEQQKVAEQAIQDGVPKNTKYDASNAALVSIDPKTGEILAMVGSKDYWDNSIDGQVNVAASPRQPGSSFKPIAYATAFKSKDFSPSRIMYDFETDFGGGYTPKNYTTRSYGPLTIRQALANSLNVPAVKIMSLAGIDEVLRTASDMGITTLTQRDRYGLSLVLGAGEVAPVEMAGAFSTFANGGVKHKTTPILKITNVAGKILYEHNAETDKTKQALDPQIAYEITSILTDNNSRSLVLGTRTALNFPDRTVAAKTGTTSSFRDAWTVGYTPSIAVAVWVGNSNNKAMKNGADGSVLAGPIFHQFIDKALANTPNEEFARPEGIQEVTVEKYSNKLPNEFSKEKTTDIFASWQVPTEKDDVNKIVKVCKGTDLLAPDGLAEQLTENRVFTNVRSERPDYPNWEGPVHAWAVQNGLVSSAPTEKCDASKLNLSLNFINPKSGVSVSGETSISSEITNAQSNPKVEYFVNGVSIGQSSVAPYSVNYNFNSLEPGDYKLSATVIDGNGVTANTEIDIKVVESALQISNASTKIGADGLSAELTWTTSIQSFGSVSYRLEDGIAQTASSSDFTAAHKVTFNNLLLGKKYLYTITAKDAKGSQVTQDGNFTTTAQ
jgi:1A family penicillin-binding protein